MTAKRRRLQLPSGPTILLGPVTGNYKEPRNGYYFANPTPVDGVVSLLVNEKTRVIQGIYARAIWRLDVVRIAGRSFRRGCALPVTMFNDLLAARATA